jgi:2-oxo-3-hexenedioate decarboxylase
MLAALDAGVTAPLPSARIPDLDFPDAYGIAREVHAERLKRGERAVGRKIGYTNRKIWAQYGMDRPIWAHVYAHTVHDVAPGQEAVQPLAGMVAPRIEPEIAFGVRTSPPAGCTDPAEILRSLEWFAHSFEIVDCHYPDWKFTPPDSVADLSHHAALWIGPRQPITADNVAALVDQLRDVRVTLSRDGTVVDQGVGANALGHPAIALAHLVDLLSAEGGAENLQPGEAVTTGTLTAAWPIHAGETWTTQLDGLPLPGLRLTFA